MSGNGLLRDMPKGRWWIVWIDHVVPPTTSVHVAIAPLPYGPLAHVDLRDAASLRRIVLVDVRALPMLAIGDIISDRRIEKSVSDSSFVASVCDEPESGETVQFEFDVSTQGLREHGRKTAPVRDFSFDMPSRRYCGLSDLATSRNSSVLQIGSTDERWFLIPAAETIRSFMAPTSEMMAGLFGQTLSAFLQTSVQNLSISDSDRPSVAFSLVGGYGRRHAPYFANLIQDYNPTGARVGARIYASLHEPDPTLKPEFDGGRHQDVVPGSSALPVCFPFYEGRMSIRAKCLRMRDDAFLICRILGGAWPSMPGFVLIEEVPKRDNDLSPTFRRVLVKPSGSAPDTETREGGGKGGVGSGPAGEDIALREAPSSFGEMQQVSVEPQGWSKLPQVSAKRKAVNRPPVEVVPEEDRNFRGLSFGAPSPIGGRKPGTVDRSAPSAPERFQQASRSLDRLAAGGQIFSHENLAETDVVHGSRRWLIPDSRDGLDVWTFPASDASGWTVLAARDGEPRRPRSLFIRLVMSNDLEPFYWISIEGRGDDRYAVLLVAFTDGFSNSDVPAETRRAVRLLAVIDRLSSSRGRVADPVGFFSGLRCGPGGAVVLDHKWVRQDAGAAQDGAGTEQSEGVSSSPEFDDEAVMRAIKTLLSVGKN